MSLDEWPEGQIDKDSLDIILHGLNSAKDAWVERSSLEHIQVLRQIKSNLNIIANDWVKLAAQHKKIPLDSPLMGEEWLSGPYALMSACNAFIKTFLDSDKKNFKKRLNTRKLSNGQLSIKAIPSSIWDHMILSGVKAEVWMQPHVNRNNLSNYIAQNLRKSSKKKNGKIALVLGAGNISSIAPLDCFQKLFLENQVVLLKLNPVNEYLFEHLNFVLEPIISQGALKIVKGNGEIGHYLTQSEFVDEIHITGSSKTHNKIVWGEADVSVDKKTSSIKNSKRITSELGAVCPTIVVPGPWSKADIKFQSENIATQKLHNAGFNCIACQVLVMPKKWSKKENLMTTLISILKESKRFNYYPGSDERVDEYRQKSDQPLSINNNTEAACFINKISSEVENWHGQNEVFASAMSICEIENNDAKSYLEKAILFANEKLYGSLGANILIHPKTIEEIGKQNFEKIIQNLKYWTIAVNGWSALGFLLSQCPWGAYPGHTLEDIQSGIGTVHNALMLSDTERSVIWAPWRPFPRGILSGQFSMLPKPPWFISNKRQDKLGMLLTRFEYKRSWLKIPRIFFNALLG